MSMEAFARAEDRVLERFNIEAKRCLVDAPAIGGKARVLVSGKGPPVMMVIGAGPPAGLWAPLMAELSGFTLYVVDPPGMGGTHPVRYTTATVRAIAVEFLDQVRSGLGLDRPSVIAQSVGGLWSIWFALDRPQQVPALVLVACPAVLLGHSAPFPLRLMSVPVLGALLMRLQPPSAKQVDRMAALANEDFSPIPELRDLWLELERLPDSASSLRGMINANERLRGARPEVQLTAEQLTQLQAPVEIIWGANDPFGPPELGRRAAELIPHAEFHLVPGGHAPWLKEPARVASLVSPFLHEHAVH